MSEARDTSNSAGTEGVERRDSYGSAMNDEGKRLRLIRMKHKYREHFVKRLFDGAGPVFVAAIINRSVVAVITAIVGNSRSANRDEIVVNFVYALFVAHLLCVCIAVFVPDTYPLFTYYFRVAIETCGFAWNSTATLIVFKWLYNDQTHNPTLSIAAWLVIVFVVFTLVLVVTYVVHTCVKPSRDVHRRLDTIMTEVCSQRIVVWILLTQGYLCSAQVFALPLSYTFSVIIALLVYKNASTSYLSGTEDDNIDSYDSLGGNCYILYAVGITAIVFFCQVQSIKILPIVLILQRFSGRGNLTFTRSVTTKMMMKSLGKN
jgi:hypothetical protein